MNEIDSWPAGRTWVFQGTVAEDATAGTHFCTLTVTPGTGNEMQVLYGMIVAGNGAANLTDVWISDTTAGTIRLAQIIPNALSLAANERVSFPITGKGVTEQNVGAANPSLFVSGSMALIMRVQTATISLTHTFSVVCRIKGAAPTATLADTVGTPVLTTNTSAVF